jgi:hypothetical protein
VSNDKTRYRVISVRVSDEEYEDFRELATARVRLPRGPLRELLVLAALGIPARVSLALLAAACALLAYSLPVIAGGFH